MAGDDIEWLDDTSDEPSPELPTGRRRSGRRRRVIVLAVAVVAVGAGVGFALSSGDDRAATRPAQAASATPSTLRPWRHTVPVPTPSARFLRSVRKDFPGARYDWVVVAETATSPPQYRFTAGALIVYVSRLVPANDQLIETRDEHQLIATTRHGARGTQVTVNAPTQVLTGHDFEAAKRLSSDPDVPS